MARFMIKASEYKNVCKAVNDRKLAELKKEVIEILKKQDEREFKKAVDYLNSQEFHYTHLEKSISGKWIEKAGYGIGTVRTWKGKKYKKVAPGKWVRVFDKEGHGTNVAIGKLIAKVQKCENVEDLMALVMANKSRFVDENGNDLPILSRLRAEVDIKNEKLSGERSPYIYGVDEDVNRERNKIFDKKKKITKEEAQLHGQGRKISQIPTSELKKEKAQYERRIENKTRSKRDSLNNAIFRESYQRELDAINKELDKRNGKKTDKSDKEKALKEVENMIDNAGDYDDIEELEKERQKLLKELGKEKKNEKPAEKKYKGLNESELKKEIIKEYDKMAAMPDKKTQDIDGTIAEIQNKNNELYETINAKFGDKTRNVFIEAAVERLTRKDKKNKQPAEKEKEWFDKDEVEKFSEIMDMEKPSLDRLKLMKQRQEIALKNAKDEEKSDGSKGRVKIAEEKLKIINQKINEAQKDEKQVDNKESDYVAKKEAAKEGYWSDEFKERNMNNIKNKIAAMKEDGASDKKIKDYLNDTIETNEKDIPWRENAIKDGRVKGNQANDYRDTIQERKVRIENCKELLKDYENETDNKTYWIQDSKGNRITSEDVKARIKDQLNQIDSFNELIAERSKADSVRMEAAKRSLEEDNKYLMDRLNPEDRKEMESEYEKHQNRSDAMKGNKNAEKFGADWEEKRKEIQSKLSANVDKMLGGREKAKDVYEKLQITLDKQKADAELYRKYLGNQEEPEKVKEFRKWCNDVMEQYKDEVSKTPSKEIISKWEETARNTPTEKLEEVLNGKQKIDRTNEYENFIDATIINEFAKDKDLVFPQPYTALKTFAEHKYDDSDKVRLEVIKKELNSRKEKSKNDKVINEEIKNRALDKIKKFAGKKINSKPIEITKVEDEGKNSGFFTFEFKSGDDTYKMTYDSGFGGEKGGASIKKINKSLLEDLFDFAELENEIDEQKEEDEENFTGTDYNDYSAEQPELFNSTEFKVREALNRRFNCL